MLDRLTNDAEWFVIAMRHTRPSGVGIRRAWAVGRVGMGDFLVRRKKSTATGMIRGNSAEVCRLRTRPRIRLVGDGQRAQTRLSGQHPQFSRAKPKDGNREFAHRLLREANFGTAKGREPSNAGSQVLRHVPPIGLRSVRVPRRQLVSIDRSRPVSQVISRSFCVRDRRQDRLRCIVWSSN